MVQVVITRLGVVLRTASRGGSTGRERHVKEHVKEHVILHVRGVHALGTEK